MRNTYVVFPIDPLISQKGRYRVTLRLSRKLARYLPVTGNALEER